MTVLDRTPVLTAGTTAAPSIDRLAPVLLAAGVVVAPIALGVAFRVDQVGLPRIDPAEYVAGIEAHRGGYLAGTLLYGLGTALSIVNGLAVRRVLGGRLGLLMAVLGGITGVLAGCVTGMRTVLLGAVGPEGATPGTVEVFTAWQESPWFGVMVPMLLSAVLSTLLLVGSVLVTGWLPRWVAAAVLVGTVLSSGEFGTAVTAAGGVLLTVAALPLARAVLATR